ncbi:GAF domain-containing protein [Paenibacillus sp. P25]|nr:GAF domain-containing protein [Paenibacillus sp. P25]
MDRGRGGHERHRYGALTEEPIMVTGSEHYSVASHRWSCAAAPIRNDDGKLLGILDVSCPVDRAHPYTLGMVSSVAYTIERELSIRTHRDEMELVQQSMDLLESDKPVIICSTKQTVVCASKPVRQAMPRWQGRMPERSLNTAIMFKWNSPSSPASTAAVSEPVSICLKGTPIRQTPITSLHRPARRSNLEGRPA